MKVLLKNPRTGLYLCGRNDDWTCERDKAWDFGGSFQATKYALERRFHEVELVFAFEDPALDLSAPIAPKGQRGGNPPG